MADFCWQEHGDVFVLGALRLVDGDGKCGGDGIFRKDRKRVEDEVVAGSFAALGWRFFEHEAGRVAVEDDDSRVAVIELEHFLVARDDEELTREVAGVIPLDGFALRFLFGAPEALDFGTNFFVDVFDTAEASAFGTEDSLCQRKLPDLVASSGFAVVWIICFGAGALRFDLLGELGELGKIAGPFGDERFDALVFFFFGERGVVGF